MMENLKKAICKNSNSNSLILIAFEILLVPTIFISKFLSEIIVPESSELYEDVITLLTFIFQYVLAAGVPMLIFYRTKRGREISEEKPLFVKPKMPWKWVFKYVMISFFVGYTAQFFSKIFFFIIEIFSGTDFQAVDFSASPSTLSKVTNIIAMMFLAPFFEELLFRGTLTRNSTFNSSWSAIIATGIFFGLWHTNYDQTIAAAVMGICGGFIYVKTESILPSMLMHFFFNSFGAASSILVSGIDVEKLKENALNSFSPEIMKLVVVGYLLIAAYIVGLICFITELSKNKKCFSLKNYTPKLPESKKFKIYFSAPATVAAALLLIALTVLRAMNINVFRIIAGV